MNGNVKIRIENLTKKWGKIVGIENLNLEIDRGDFITLLGPSGCGKTTTLRSITGLEEPMDGRIWLDKTWVSNLSTGWGSFQGLGGKNYRPAPNYFDFS